MSNESLFKALNQKYEDTGPEKIGFVVQGELVEVDNVHPDPENFFDVDLDDIEKYEPISEAIWHTQPGRPSQLSYEDYVGFFNFPNHRHIVVGMDGIRVYRVEDGAVVKDYVHLS